MVLPDGPNKVAKQNSSPGFSARLGLGCGVGNAGGMEYCCQFFGEVYDFGVRGALVHIATLEVLVLDFVWVFCV